MTRRPTHKRSVRRVAKPPADSATLDGSSLLLGDAFSIDSLLQVIDRYRAFSFDVFDTLVTRIVDEPKYVFDLVGSRLRVPHFRQVRMNAEIAARAKNRSAHHCDEVNLLDIYSEMNFQRFSREVLIEHELQAERDVLRPNVGVCRVVDMLAAAGKRVIATSDTYFSGEELASLLAHCGIKVDAIYTSADHKDINAGKFNCLLFRRVAQDEGLLPGEILHLGNDRRSDYENALMAGLHAIHLRAPREVCFTRTAANLHRLHVLDVSQTLPSKILLGSYVESHINGRRAAKSVFNEFGFCYAGPLILAYSIWLIEECRRRRLKKLILFGRDGYSIENCLRQFKSESVPDVTVLPISRRLAVECLPAADFDGFVRYFPVRCSAGEAVFRLKMISAIDSDSLFGTQDFRCNEVDFQSLLLNNRKRIVEVAAERWQALRIALEEAIAPYDIDDIAFVDVGWGLTIHAVLDRLLERRVAGLYFGRHERAYDNGHISVFAFDGHRRGDAIQRRFFRCIELAELAFADHKSPVIRYDLGAGGANPVSDLEARGETLKAPCVVEVQNGVRQFLEQMEPWIEDLGYESSFAQVTIDNFLVLIEHPTNTERFVLGLTPHDREIADGLYRPISDFWSSADEANPITIQPTPFAIEPLVLEPKVPAPGGAPMAETPATAAQPAKIEPPRSLLRRFFAALREHGLVAAIGRSLEWLGLRLARRADGSEA